MRIDEDGLAVWSDADLVEHAETVVRAELDRRHDAALAPVAVEIAADILAVLIRYNITPSDIPPGVNLGRMVLEALAAARQRIDGTGDSAARGGRGQ